MYSISGLLVKM